MPAGSGGLKECKKSKDYEPAMGGGNSVEEGLVSQHSKIKFWTKKTNRGLFLILNIFCKSQSERWFIVQHKKVFAA